MEENVKGMPGAISSILEQLQSSVPAFLQADDEQQVRQQEEPETKEKEMGAESDSFAFSFNAAPMPDIFGVEKTEKDEKTERKVQKPFSFMSETGVKKEAFTSFLKEDLEDLDFEKAKEEFSIENDSCADWAVRCIKKEFEEFERLKVLADEQIAEIQEKLSSAEKRYENKTKYLKSKLKQYFEGVPEKKETKTKASYRLLSGTLTLKKGGQEYKKDEDALVQYLKSKGMENLIQIKETVKWADLKKQLTIQEDGKVIDTNTGEVLECVSIIEKEDKFDVEF